VRRRAASCTAALALALGLLGCGRQELDLLVSAQKDDPCLGFQSESECDANAALGCSFQPNAEGCQSTDASCQPGMCRGGDPFVRRVERSFFLNGAPFRFVGVSSWALLEATQCTSSKPDEREAWMQRAYDELVPSRSKVARFFAFQSSAGPSGNDFTLFDSSVRYARRAGVRLMFILEHAEGSCSQGGHRENAWYAGGYKSPDGNYTLSYRDFAQALAERYRDEPTVLGYVVMQSLGGDDRAALSGFVNDVGQLLHGVAPSQLVSLDLNWNGGGGDDGASYRALQELPAVDLIDIDDYSFQETLEPLDPVLLATLGKIDKPAVVGEGAFLLDSSDDAALAKRAQKARVRMSQWHDWGLSGTLLWAYQPGWGAASEEFDARPGDPLLQPGGVVANAPW
jgi:hypothetical protein